MFAVEARDIRYTYPSKGNSKGRQALKGISLQARRGETFGFLGPNGSGKTTFFKIISTLIRPSGGFAAIFGHDLKTDLNEARKKIGVVFQYPSLDKKLTVEENLIHHGNLFGMWGNGLKRKVDEQMERFNLTSRRADLVETLSGGLRRRVELAKGLIPGPELLILDEPSTGLDPVARRELWDTIAALKKKNGISVLVTTHLGEEGDKCDRLAIMNDGEVMAVGSPNELKAEIGGDVITIQSDAPETLKDNLAAKFGVQAKLVEGSLRMEKARGHEFIPRIVEAFPGQVRAVTLGKPTLEDVFVHRTGRAMGAGGGGEPEAGEEAK